MLNMSTPFAFGGKVLLADCLVDWQVRSTQFVLLVAGFQGCCRLAALDCSEEDRFV
jgi:hypothetical protein